MSLVFNLRCETVFALYLPIILRTISQVDFKVVLLLNLDTYCCQLARLFSWHARLALARAILKLPRFSEVIFVLKLAKADFLAFIASLHSVLNQGLQRFFCFAMVFGIHLLAIIHKTSVNKTIGSAYNSIVSNVNFLYINDQIAPSQSDLNSNGVVHQEVTPIFKIIGKRSLPYESDSTIKSISIRMYGEHRERSMAVNVPVAGCKYVTIIK